MAIYRQRRQTLILGFWLMLLGFLPTGVFADDLKKVEDQVFNVSNRILVLLEQNQDKIRANPSTLSSFVESEILPFIEFDAMSKLTLGRYWRSASEAQQQRFVNAYRNMLIRNYASRMLPYAGSRMKIKYSTSSQAGYATVYAQVLQKNGAPIDAIYELRNKSGTWKAYNVVIAGINLITNYRTNFTREVAQKGLDALISRLEKGGE